MAYEQTILAGRNNMQIGFAGALLGILSAGIIYATPAAADGPLIAVFTKNRTNPAYENARIAADKVAAAMGARTQHYVPSKPDDVEQQKQLVDEALLAKPDLILFIPVDDVAMVDSLKKMTDAHIPVVTAVSMIKGDVVTFVGSDDVEVGYKAARDLFTKLGGRGKVVVLEGLSASTTSRDRSRGIERALKEFPGIEVLDSVSGKYDRAYSRTVMVEMLKKHPDIDGIVAANDPMALGALDAMHEAGRKSLVVGANGAVEAVKRIGAGEMLSSVDFNTFRIACIATEAALRAGRGETVPARIMVPAELIDASNYKASLTPFAERNCPKWADVVKP
jgi:ribose transport system substrate-binding protein